MAYAIDPSTPDIIVDYAPREYEGAPIRKGGIRLPYIKPNYADDGSMQTGRYVPPNCQASRGLMVCREEDGSITVNGVAKGVVTTKDTPKTEPQAAPQADKKWFYLALAGLAFMVLTKK